MEGNLTLGKEINVNDLVPTPTREDNNNKESSSNINKDENLNSHNAKNENENKTNIEKLIENPKINQDNQSVEKAFVGTKRFTEKVTYFIMLTDVSRNPFDCFFI